MDDKLDEVIKKYPVIVKSRRRIRGAVLLDTDKGIYMAKMYTASRKRLLFEEEVKAALISAGYVNVDYAVKNIDGELLTDDGSGNKWLVKKWYNGVECDIKDIKKIMLASSNMAVIHKLMVIGREDDIQPPVKTNKLDIEALLLRHNKEIKKVHGYIREKRQKNEMEICLLNSYKNFSRQGIMAEEFLKESGYSSLCNEAVSQGRVLHGSYNYHNIILSGEQVVTTNFEKSDIGLQVIDLYDFIRKVMEKNSWNMDIGINAIEAYRKERELGTEERKVLYALLLYPEKYWKLVNFYYNGKKSWMSAKNFEKLKRICSQEEERHKFLKEVKRLLI
ncbi:MAG: hypothetical protein K2O92_07395 [Lachnospiraceae bacterium]|nr:hypothetical protein [Lachnospiraceae bacterium]